MSSSDPSLRRLAILVLLAAASDAASDTEAATWLREGGHPWATICGWTQGQIDDLLARRSKRIRLTEAGPEPNTWPPRARLGRGQLEELVIQAEVVTASYEAL